MSMTNVKIQNIMLKYNMNANFRDYTDLVTKGTEMIYAPDEQCHIIKKYGRVHFSTYFNCLQMAHWMKHTFAKKFYLHLEFEGKAAIEFEGIYRNSKNINREVLSEQVINAAERTEINIEIPASNKPLISFSITALEHFKLFDGCYLAQVDENELKDVYISLVSTTFKKEEYITKNIQTLRDKVFFDGSEMKEHLFVNVIDNGRTLNAETLNTDNIKIYPNMNVGGAGGFTRGMIESIVMKRKPTHVLLMDDDVLLMEESLFRTYFLLRILRPEYEEYFLSGAMFDYDHRQIQYEDIGYVHPEDGSYGPLKDRMDMCKLENLLRNEEMASRTKNESYAGWWYCCIPMPLIEKNGLPLPVFVRGDDVEFSIRNKAKFLTLNGISIWHVGFAGKFNAAMELYQVHRNSLIIQASSNICENIDFMKRMKILFWKEITRFAYNNAEQILDAIDDFMRGPEFLKNLDGEASIKSHGSKNEKLRPIEEFSSTCNISHGDPYSYKKLNIIQKFLYVITINGHLLPNILLQRRPEIISFDWFFVPGKNFCRRTLLAVNQNDRTACIRTIDRKRCFSLIKRYIKTMGNYNRNYINVKNAYRNEFANMTSVYFWKEYLKI